ncbi:hypothetical protein A3709_11980 [Halioglobus sp. HI00S01]|nr:hypothetical protein A3709_11980 [Halioglobus sp. HI00S01]
MFAIFAFFGKTKTPHFTSGCKISGWNLILQLQDQITYRAFFLDYLKYATRHRQEGMKHS